MKRIAGGILFCLLLGSMTVCTTMNGRSGHELGKLVYKEHCYRCHGSRGDGNGGPISTDLRDPQLWKYGPEERIRTAVKYGFAEMPPIRISDREVDAVIEYMTQTFKPPAIEISPEET